MDDEIKDALYMIEGEPALSLVKHHIAEVQRVRAEVRALAELYGAEQISTDRITGVLSGIVFKRNEHHADFTKPNKRGVCWPKRKTDAAAKFAAQVGRANQETTISEAFSVPLTLCHEGPNSNGWTHIGSMLNACRFLYLGSDGPYALLIPDVAAHIAYYEARGETVEQSFDMNLPGCRRILHEEWELMVAQHNLEKKRQEAVPA